MNILITGGAGFLGSLLARELLKRERLRGQTLTRLLLSDRSACPDPEIVNHPKVHIDTGDLLERLPDLLKQDYDAVFHLASAVSGECETDFGLGLRSNLDATRALLEGLRAQHGRTGQAPIFFFSSSVAVFGSDPAISLPSVVTDTSLPTPQSSYGIHKFICEQLVADYTRKGFIDGRVARLMTVSVRPGKPNGAASSFLSGIIREPLAGLEARCPVSLDTAVALSSPLTSIAGVLAVVEASRESFGGRTALNLPALTVTVGQMLQALREVAGDQVAERVRVEPDEQIMRIVGGWPSRFNCQRTQKLGLEADACYRDIILQYLDMTRV